MLPRSIGSVTASTEWHVNYGASRHRFPRFLDSGTWPGDHMDGIAGQSVDDGRRLSFRGARQAADRYATRNADPAVAARGGGAHAGHRFRPACGRVPQPTDRRIRPPVPRHRPGTGRGAGSAGRRRHVRRRRAPGRRACERPVAEHRNQGPRRYRCAVRGDHQRPRNTAVTSQPHRVGKAGQHRPLCRAVRP